MAIHPYVVDREKCNLWTKESSLLMRSFAMDDSCSSAHALYATKLVASDL